MQNFGDLPEQFRDRDKASVVILPVPYDETSSWMKGADKGPKTLLEASANLELYDIETGFEAYRKGIFTDDPVEVYGKPEDMVEMVFRRSLTWVKRDKFLVTIGGEHTVCLGPIKAFKQKFRGLSVLQIDAHADLRNVYDGTPFNHACVMARVKEICPVVQVGIRSMDIEEKSGMDEKRVFWAHEIEGDEAWMERVVDQLTGQVYITIDLDGLDPSIMPSTGTPEPGGLGWYTLLKLMKRVISARNVVGFDVVELCPDERNKAPDFLAAKLIYKMLNYQFQS
jgi:agmatinase